MISVFFLLVEVIECAVCRATTDILDKYIKKEEMQERGKVIDIVCSRIPSKYNQKVSDILLYLDPYSEIEQKLNTPVLLKISVS